MALPFLGLRTCKTCVFGRARAPLNRNGKLAYLIKHRFPSLFRGIDALARAVTGLRFGRRRVRALADARLVGTMDGLPAETRPLQAADAGTLTEFLGAMPKEHLEFFRPDGFDAGAVARVVRSRAFACRQAPTGGSGGFVGACLARESALDEGQGSDPGLGPRFEPRGTPQKMLLISFKKANVTEMSNILGAICRPASRI